MEELKTDSIEFVNSLIRAMEFLYKLGFNGEPSVESHEKMRSEYSNEEIYTLGRFMNRENPLRTVHYVLLDKLDEDLEGLYELSDKELKTLVVKKIRDERNIKRAERFFFIQE